MAQAFVPGMIESGWGRVISINTECSMQNFPRQSAYTSGKRGMDGVLRVLAKEVGEHGITVNQVAPGWTISEKSEASASDEHYWSKVPMQRRGTAQEIANTVLFLAVRSRQLYHGCVYPCMWWECDANDLIHAAIEVNMERHIVEYEVLNNRNLTDDTVRHWEVAVHASTEELQTFAETGYLIREGLFQGEALERLRDALDHLETQEAEARDKEIAGKGSWGFIPRNLMDKDKVFLDLLKFQPTLSIARAMMGPLVRLRGLSARIGYPGDDLQHQTPWHQHMRVISDPLPPVVFTSTLYRLSHLS